MSNLSRRLTDLSPAQKRALLAQHLRNEQRQSQEFPLSFAQQRLWFLDQLEPGVAAYHLPIAWRFKGNLDTTALEQSLTAMVQRHEILRTTFSIRDGQPIQVINPAQPVSLPVVDLRDDPPTAREPEVQRRATAEAQKAFDLAHGPLWRAILFRLATEEHVLLLTLHHLIFDAWSHEVFWRELSTFYGGYVEGTPVAFPVLPIQYADFAVWQRQTLQGEKVEGQLEHWRQQLAGSLPLLDLPTDKPRPPRQTFAGARQTMQLLPSLTTALKALSRQAGVTLFMTLLAAFQTLLYRYTGQTDLQVGTPVAGRLRTETEGLIGCFVNTLVLRTNLGGNPRFRELLERVRQVSLRAYAHQELPFEHLVEKLQLERDLSRSPLFQVMFVFQNAPQAILELPGLAVRALLVHRGQAPFDLTLSFWDDAHTLTGLLEYRTDLFKTATITRLLGHLQTVLQSVCADPEQRLSHIPLLTAAERQQVVGTWNDTRTDFSPICMHHLVEAQVEKTPDAVAVACGSEQLTYRVLNRRANQLANYLRKLGVSPEARVGLCVSRSLEMLVGMLGILKAGGAYVPLDANYPQQRLAFMLADAGVQVVVTQERLIDRLSIHKARIVCLDTDWKDIAQEAEVDVVSDVTPENLAYVIYTSGSTGSPKGVLVTHRGLGNLAHAQIETFAVQPHSRVFQFASLSFDASVSECVMTLGSGARLCLGSATTVSAGSDVTRLLEAHAITHITLPPSVLATLCEAELPHLKTIIVAGEACWPDLVERWSQGRRFFNAYGPTEATVCATMGACEASGLIPPIGRTMANTQAYVLDRHLQPVPIGVPGELYVGGLGLARGYLNNLALTAEKFVPNPFNSANEAASRLYRTGDRVRYRSDGNLVFQGRFDHQVKLRGYRIELGEIEAVLSEHAEVQEAVVVAKANASGEHLLVAYMVPRRQVSLNPSALRTFLRAKLPNYMIPAVFIQMDTLPLTPGGKVNRHALPTPGYERPELDTVFIAPRTPTEDLLMGIWGTVLGLERVGIHDNFFALGGHSLLATQVVSRIREAWQVEIPLRILFEVPTIAGLAAWIEAAHQSEQDLSVPPIKPIPRQHTIPLSVTQEKMWELKQSLPGLPFFHIPRAMRLKGRLNMAALEKSFNEVMRRHDILRTTFTIEDGQPVQVIAPASHMPLTLDDFTAVFEAEGEAAWRFERRLETIRPFDFEQGPLMRIRLLQLSPQEYVLLLTMHHLISDGWSMGVLARELTILYETFSRGDASPLPELAIQYADFAAWQHQLRAWKGWEVQLTYWKQQLHDPLPRLELPTDRPRPQTLLMQNLLTVSQPFALPQTLSEALVQMSRQEGCTLFMTLMAAFNILLYAYTRQEDLRVGTLVANRNRPETEALIGFFANTVIIRTPMRGNPTLREILHRIRATTLAAYAHQDVPFEEIAQTLGRERHLDRLSLFQVMLVSQDAMQQPIHLSGLTLDVLREDYMTATTCDLVMMISQGSQGLSGSCLYKPYLFEAATIIRMLSHFEQVLGNLVHQPNQRLNFLALCAAG
jgi:amino acid adenylation domain-containing protein